MVLFLAKVLFVLTRDQAQFQQLSFPFTLPLECYLQSETKIEPDLGLYSSEKNVSVNVHLRPVPHGQLRGICKFCAARGSGICQPRGHSRAFDTLVVSYPNITTRRILLRFHWKQADRLIRQGREKLQLQRVVKACSRF